MAAGGQPLHSRFVDERARTFVPSVSALDSDTSDHSSWSAIDVCILAVGTLGYPLRTLFLSLCLLSSRGLRRPN